MFTLKLVMKMLKLFLLFAILALVVGVLSQVALAATTGTVAATVTVQNISLTVTDGTVAYGTLGLNATASTRSPVDLQTATNNGNVAETFTIKGQNSANWTLAATAGADNYVHGFCIATCTTPPTNYTALTTSNQTLATPVAASGTQTFDLYINTPTTSTNFTSQSVDVTITATAS